MSVDAGEQSSVSNWVPAIARMLMRFWEASAMPSYWLPGDSMS